MSFFGLDIGSYKLKIAQVEKGREKARLVAIGSSLAPAKSIFSELETDLTALAEAIKKLHREADIGTKNVVTALPEDKVYTKLVTFPQVSKSELESAIKWEAEQYIPIPLEEVSLDYQVVSKVKEGEREKQEILLVAAPKALVEKIIKVLKTAKLNPVSLESEMISLSRSLVSDSEANLLVDLGARATDLAIIDGGQMVFTRSIPTAGEALTRAVATTLGLDPSQAEEYKKTYGADTERLEGKIKEAINPILKVIIDEMEKAIHFYRTSKKKSIKRIILTGGTAGLPEVVSVLAQNLNLEIQVGDPFSKLEKDEVVAKISGESAFLYGVAIGLALKEAE